MTNPANISVVISDSFTKFRMGAMDGRSIFLSVPTFDCGWYWGFGYLGNSQCHFHLDSLDSMDSSLVNKNMYDQLKLLFGDSLTIADGKLWKFCEVVQTIYTLKKAAEVFGRGGSYYTSNPDAELLKNQEWVNHINYVLIPAQINTLFGVVLGQKA